MENRKAKLSELKAIIKSDYSFVGDEDVIINGLNLCNRYSEYDSIITYITSDKFLANIRENSSVKAIFLTIDTYNSIKDNLQKRKLSYFLVSNPELEFYALHELLYNETNFYEKFNFKSVIGKNCDIHPSVVIEHGVIIGNNVRICPNSVIRKGSVIDDNVIIGCCSVIGSEGFQAIEGMKKVITHVGRTHICENVCIGDNCTVGNSLFEGFCEIGKNSKLDNHVHFAHNCRCGDNTVLTACTLVMGSVTIGNNVWFAPNSVILNKVTIADNSFIGTLSYINKDTAVGDVMVGIPAKKLR